MKTEAISFGFGSSAGESLPHATFGARRAAVILASAILHAFAFPPWEQSWLAWIALVPFLLALRGLTPRQGFAAGWLWGTAAIWVVAYWVPPALMFYYEQPWWFAALFCIVGSQILWGTYYAAFGAVACVIANRSAGVLRVALLSCAWVTAELARSHLLTGEPWMLLGYGLMPELPMIQIADFGSVYAISFVAFFVNAALAEWLGAIPIPPPYEGGGQGEVSKAGRSGRLTPPCSLLPKWEHTGASVLAALLLVAATWLYGHSRLQETFSSDHETDVAVIQGNIPVGAQWRAELYAKGLREYLDASAAAAAGRQLGLIVWPESAVTFFLPEEATFLRQIRELLATTGAELVVGGPHLDDRDPARPLYFNSAFAVSAAGIDGRYDKAHLLPFGEYFPLKMIEFLRRRFERVRTFTPGSGETLLHTPAGKAAVVICFEAIFPEKVRRQMARGAEILVNLTNDVWLGNHAGPRQHASMVALRAVENRTWVIRATTTGVSTIIDPHGRVIAASDTDVAATLHARVAALRVSTFYQRHGDVFAYGCAACLLVFSVLSVRVRNPV